MGTRNLTLVVLDKQIKVAQYCQWDGYWGGQGQTVAEFINARNKGKSWDQFAKSVRACRWIDDAARDAAWVKSGAAPGAKSVSFAISDKHRQLFPELSRDTGAEILRLIHSTRGKGLDLTDSTGFAADSLFCEYAYLLDLDKQVLELYRGFNKKPVPKSNRFAKLPLEKNYDGTASEYYHIKLYKRIPFKDVPAVMAQLGKRE